jgi:hypothetical protein
MIIKSLSRKSNPSQLIAYATRYIVKEVKEKKGHATQEHMKVLVRHNLRSKKIEGMIAEFKENESYRIYHRKDSVILFHTILSIHPKDKDKVSLAMLKDLSKKLIELRGSNCLHLAVSHMEKDHAHAHLISSGVQVNGRSSRVSKPAFKRILRQLEQYQQEKYPSLEHSKNNHEKKNGRVKEGLIAYLNESRSSKKLDLNGHLKKAYEKANTYEDFIGLLSTKDYQPYYRNGRLQGIIFNDRKYRLSNLGFEGNQIEELKTRKESTVLSELQAIRNRKPREREIVMTPVVEQIDSEGSSELNSIRSTRERAKSLGGFERVFEDATT